MSSIPCQVPIKWTNDRMPSLKGKVAIVTGANSGVGFSQAKHLALKGAHVVCACRNEQRGHKAVKEIQLELNKDAKDSGSVQFMQLDLADLDSVKSFADQCHQSLDKLDILLNNAGVMWVPYCLSPQGYESHFAINHLGHFALTAHLFSLLRNSTDARVVNVSSMGYSANGPLDMDKLFVSEDEYDSELAYGQSKLCNLLFAFELDRRCKEAGIRNVKAVATHPGITVTNLIADNRPENPWHLRLLRNVVSFVTKYVVGMDAEQGSTSQLYAAAGDEIDGGEYISFDKLGGVRGYPTKGDVKSFARSEIDMKKLWKRSEECASLSFEIK